MIITWQFCVGFVVGCVVVHLLWYSLVAPWLRQRRARARRKEQNTSNSVVRGREAKHGKSWLRHLVEADEDYQKARSFAKGFKPKEGEDYTWSYEYAESSYARLMEAMNALDAKADSIVNHTSVLSAFAVVAFAYEALAVDWALGIAIGPTFVCAIAAICKAALARRPAAIPHPPSVKNALRFVRAHGCDSKARFIPQFHVAAQALRVVTDEKGALVRSASHFVVWSVVLLAVPLFVALLLRVAC
jgi:hypothetical protein